MRVTQTLQHPSALLEVSVTSDDVEFIATTLEAMQSEAERFTSITVKVDGVEAIGRTQDEVYAVARGLIRQHQPRRGEEP